MNKFEQLCDLSQQLMAQKDLPGMGLAVLHEDKIQTAGLGITSVDHPLDVTADTLFQIGSISKTMTGTVAMRLIEQKKLELDGNVRDYIPDFKVQDKAASENVTIRHLLTHTGGWAGDYFHETGRGDDNLKRYVEDMASLPQLAPLGEFFSYSNSSYALLGRIIEVVTGGVFETIMQDMLFDPLGMTSATYDPTVAMTHRFAVGHETKNNKTSIKRPYAMPRAVNPMGGVLCNVGDMLRYARFYLADGTTDKGERLLQEDSIAKMHSPQIHVKKGFNIGLSWVLGEASGSNTVWHNGGTVGQLALLTLIPEHNFAFAAVTNSDQGSLVYSAVQKEAFSLFLGIEAQAESEAQHIEQPEVDLLDFVGLYSRPLLDLEIGLVGKKLVGIITPKQAFPSENALLAPPQPPMTLELKDNILLIKDGMGEGATIDILRNTNGDIGWIRFGSRLLPKITG